LLAAAGEPEAKQRLRDATDAAIAAGVFGVPTVLVEGEIFWGCDSFAHLERFLRGEDPIANVDLSRYLATKPSATRA
jgi:2-hydroxychromene-2-carboxylate isomerase